ncbi:MAG: transglutaminase domain-containing protein [Nitrolancea sp.]
MQRFAIREGWTSFFLVALIVFTATWSTQAADWTDGLDILTTVTIVGLLTGLILAQVERIPSVLGHVIALLIGFVVVMYEMTNFLSDNIGGRQAKLHYLWGRWTQWYTAISHGQHAEDLYLFVLMMAALIFILSYTSVWFIFRSRWIWLSLLLPGVMLFMNLGYSQHVPTGLVIVFLIGAILLMMRFSFSRRIDEWRHSGTPFPDSLVWRGLWTASYTSIAVIIIGWAVPISTQNQSIHGAWESINGPWVHVEDTFNGWFGSLRGPGVSGGIGGFASFGDSFEVGGPLHLSDQPVALVKGASAPYLAAHRYDVFDGRGWSSDIASTYQSNSATGGSSPLIPFQANETIPIPPSTTSGTSDEKYTVKILSPRGAVIYSPGQLQSVSEPTQIQVAWRNYTDQALDLTQANQQNTPPLLWPLVQALQNAKFSAPPPPEPTATPTATVEGTPAATPEETPTPAATPTPNPNLTVQIGSGTTVSIDPGDWALINSERNDLSTRSIQTRFEINSDYTVTTLFFTGELPVYSDVEAVFAQNGVGSGDIYDINSVVSDATAEQLRVAGTDYPVEITSRYLQLPIVTDRTKQLAESLAANQNNPYDVAATIETYLRKNLAYNENVGVPPKGEDAVDWFLFESKQGYCTFYASAMIEMLRVLNIPSRIAVGFYPAQYDDGSAGYLYRDLNAHAWVEVYFPQYGWVSFEPTAARAAINREPAAPSTSGNSGSLPANTGESGVNPRDFLDENPPVGGSGAVLTSNHSTTAFDWIVRGMIVVLLAIIAFVSYLWLRGTRGLTPATQFFTKAQRSASWGGVPVSSAMTPYEYAQMIGDRVPGTRQHVRYLADVYVRERYGAQPPDAQDVGHARKAWLRLRSLMIRYMVIGRWRLSRRRPDSSIDDE